MPLPPQASVTNATLLTKLKPLREKLIDVSLRSRLLNYRDLGSQTLPLLPCDLDTLYQWLVCNENELEVEGLPKSKARDEDEPGGEEAKPVVKQGRPSVDFSGEDATHDVEDGILRTRDSMLKTENRMTSLFRKYRECLDAFGSNLCFMAFGFLEWTDPKRQDEEKRYAPLILVPVALSKVKREVTVEAVLEEFELGNDLQPQRRGRARASRPSLTSRMMAYRFTVKYDGEDIADNVALRLKLENLSGGISLPAFDAEDDDASVEEYLESVERAIRRLPPEVNNGWKVVPAARLAFFSSAKEAMYRDLDPAKWPTSGLVNREWIQAALDGRDQDTTPSVTDDEVTTALHIDPIVPTVLETDGSQMRAIVRVLRGDPMVIQGPPGTGKSQTITNLIAATLAKGKSVLFVAEKMAALSVVRQRMEDSGLGRYCLELHSAKATPRQVIDQVRKRLAHQPPAAAVASQQVADRQRLNIHRIALGNYGKSIRHIDNNLESSFHDEVWKRSQLLDALEEMLSDRAVPVDSLPALTMNRDAGYAELCALIDALKVAGRCIAEGVHLTAQPWFGSCPRELPGPHMEESVRRTLGAAKQSALEWQAAEKLLPLPDQWSTPTADQWLDLHQRFQPGSAPELSECMCHELASDFTALSRYDEYLTALLAWRMPQADEARALSENSGIDKAKIEEARAAAEQIERTLISRMPHATLEELSDSGERILWLRDTLAARTATLAALAELIHIPITDETFSGGSRLAAFGARLAQTPPSVWRCFHSALLHPSSLAQILSTKKQHDALSAERDSIAAEVRLNDLMDAAKWSDLSRDLSLTAGGWFNWLPGTRGNKLRQQLRACFFKKPVNEAVAMQAVDRAQKWRADSVAFADAGNAKSLLGPAFAGMATDWSSLEAAVSLVADWVKLFGAASGQKFISEHKDTVFAQSAMIASLAAQAESHTEWMALASKLFRQDEATLRQLSTQTLQSDVTAQAKTAESLIKAIAEINLPPDTLVGAVPHLCSVALTLRDHAATVSKLVASPAFLGEWHQGLLATDTQQIAASLAWLRQIIEIEALPHAIKIWMLSEATSQRAQEVVERVGSITKTIDDWRSAMTPLTEVFAFDSYTALMSQNNLGRSITLLLSHLDAAIEAVPSLMAWYHLRESERDIEHAGGKSLWEWCREHHLNVEAIEKAAQLGFINQFIERLLTQHPELKTYHRQKLEEHRDGFRSLDKRVLNSFQKEVDRSIFRKHSEAPSGQRRGSTKDYTEMSMLHHEMSKQTRHVPVRRLVRQSGAALKHLMPCWMMGPQAVAQFLEPEKVEFDLLIIDEASQVRPEDALGSLARAKQIVIVGDSKQMPPTDVFQALGVHDLDDEVEDEDGEMVALDSPALSLTSILDTFEKQLPLETLRWHYRSQHQSLIAFSNENFYESSLIVPPSRWHASDDLGIVRHFIENGRLQDRKNPSEAAKAVDIMREHVLRESQRDENVRETLGVVAMNAVQQDLIAERWEKACKDDPLLEAALSEFTSKTTLFIRNLENVQGDERDVILISTTYGRNAAGEMHQRFGPVNKAGGWRRLNVLFTRARKRIHLVTSMVHSDVQQDTKQAESGRSYLRKYLQYAETGHLPDSGTAGFKSIPDSGFEESVARCLLGLGFEFHYQVGVQGFFIDIGVIHPDRPGQYLCGIECDGVAYHSHPIARDRDRIRQEILENRGWLIFRIWSTDWYRNRNEEIKRLHAYLAKHSIG